MNKRDIVIKYIAEHYGCTRTQVKDYMFQANFDSKGNALKEKSSIHAAKQTTDNILNKLTRPNDKGEILVIELPDEHNSQIHHLYINNEFRVIYDQLNDIDSLISTMDYSLHKLNKIKSQIDKLPGDYPKTIPLSSPDLLEFSIYARDYIAPYSGIVRTMLFYLLEKLSVMKISREDSNIFYDRIIELVRRLNEQTLELATTKKDLIFLKDQFIKRKKQLDTANRYFSHKILDKVIETVDNFDNKFLNV